MSANAFRSPLMQQIAAAARSQHRPPLVFSSHLASKRSSTTTTSKTTDNQCTTNSQRNSQINSQASSSSLNRPIIDHSSIKLTSSASASLESLPQLSHARFSSSLSDCSQIDEGENLNESKANYLLFQRTIETRRTASNYKPFDLSRVPFLRESMTRAIRCATYAPNHHRTEPTTYYRIVTNTGACDQLMEICYNVALCRNLKKRSIEEAEINAKAKMNKWKNTIGGYMVVCVSDQPLQDDEYPYKDFSKDNVEDFEYWYDTLQMRAPQTERQLEDYSSASASIQNILLSIHSEDFGAKWATGPMVRCRATRSLIGCKETDAIAGLIMIGDSKVIPREWRRRREFDGDVMREL